MPYFKFLKESFPQQASLSYLELCETLEQVASQKETGGGNILAVSLILCSPLKMQMQSMSLMGWP